MDEQSLKTLIGLSMPDQEVEDDMDDDLLPDKAIAQYDFLNIINAIGHENFREIYTAFKNVIILYPHESQLNFCRSLIDRIQDVYDFYFTMVIDFDYEEPEEVYKFVEWLEYDNAEFLFQIFNGLVKDINSIEIEQFINENWIEIQKKLLSIPLENKFIIEFVRTNNKENITKFIVENTQKNKSLIVERFYTKGE